MKPTCLTLVFWFLVPAASGQPPAISVRIYDYAGVSGKVLDKAKLEAERVLRATNLEMRWIECPPRDDRREPRHAACTGPMTSADILLRIVPRSMQTEQGLDRALGYALPFVGQPPSRAYVLYDRVRERLRQVSGVSEFRLLGYALAHEVAHLLLANDRHSRTGVMMAVWREKDLVDIERGVMEFSREEADMLEAGGKARLELIARAATAQLSQ